jgi:cardiolipin synthase
MQPLHLTLLQISLAIGTLFAVLLVGHILRQRRNPASTLAWLLLVITLPWLAVPAYLTFGTRKLQPRLAGTSPPLPTAGAGGALDRLLASAAVPPLRSGHTVDWHADGEAARSALLHTLAQARHRLDIALFLLRDDAAGHALCEALVARAADGVAIRLLIDGVGSFLLRRQVIARLRAAGVAVAWFIPLLHRPFRARSNLRNHRKLVLADGHLAWLGGRNVADEYFASDAQWVDLSLTLSGPVIANLTQLFDSDWGFATRTPPRAGNTPPSAIPDAPARAQLIAAGPDHVRDLLHESIMQQVYTAQRRIILTTPYYIPDDALQLGLCLAARRGVAVTLLLPARSNHRLADIARGRYLRELARAGVRVRLLPEAMLHAKAWLIDDDAFVGSANLDLRSLFLNFELMLRVQGEVETAWLHAWLAGLDARSHPAPTAPAGFAHELLEGIVLLIAFQL